MTQHLSAEQIKRYISRKLSASDLLFANDHLSVCDVCMSEIRAVYDPDPSAIQGMLFSDMDDLHLTYEQMSNFVDGSINEVDREIVDVHTALCEPCASEIADLRQLRETLDAAPDAHPTARGTETSILDRIFAGSFLKIAITAAALLLIAGIFWFAQRKTEEPVARVNEPAQSLPTSISEKADSPGPDSNINAAPSRIVTSLSDGNARIELDETGKLSGLPNAAFEQKVRSALTSQSVEIPSEFRKLKSAGGVLMGEPSKGVPFKINGPVGKVVESQRPNLSWQPLNGAESYRVEIYDEDFKKVASSPELKTNKWTLDRPLLRGRLYQWQVTATKDGEEIKSPVRPAPEAKFLIADSSHFAEIERARRSAGNSHLILGIVYANAGLLDEAQREFQTLLNSNQNSDITRKLLAKVKAAR